MAVAAVVAAATGKEIAEAAVAVGELGTVKEIAAAVVVGAGESERKAKMGNLAAAVEFETETTVAAVV